MRDRGSPSYPAERHSERFWERWRDVIEFLGTAALATRVDLASTFAPFDAPSAVDETLRHARTHACITRACRGAAPAVQCVSCAARCHNRMRRPCAPWPCRVLVAPTAPPRSHRPLIGAARA